MADGTIGVKAGSLSATSMRYHELAVQRWLNRLFIVREGYPVPVVFATPMDAFSQFTKLWSAANNPFQYLLDAVNEDGTPLYQPYPAPVRYPLLSVYRKNFKYRSYQNFSIHRFRHINWPTVSADVCRGELGNVTTSKMPMAWDYRYQIDFYCNRPDTQAFFVEKLMREFYKTGGTPQTWIEVKYPAWGNQLVRVYIDGEIENATPEEPEADKPVEFRTTVNIVVEGFSVDVDFQVFPALWELIIGAGSVNPDTLEGAFNPVADVDLRHGDANPTLDSRANVPARCEDLAVIGSGSIIVDITEPGTINANAFESPVFFDAGFYDGTLASTGQPTFTAGTEYVVQTGGFLFGSANPFVYADNGTMSVGLASGNCFDVIVSGGTNADASAQNGAFSTGAIFDATVLFTGTESGSVASAFFNGTLFQAILDGGTHSDSGTVNSGFQVGTLSTIIIGAGSYSEFSSLNGGFQIGELT